MAVESRHVSATLRARDLDSNYLVSIHRIRPDFARPEADFITNAITTVTGALLGGTTLTVTSELHEA